MNEPKVRDTVAAHPSPPTTPLEALAHVLAIFEDSPDEMVIVSATTNVYPEAPWTGLRLGDLRRLLPDHAHELAEKQRRIADSWFVRDRDVNMSAPEARRLAIRNIASQIDQEDSQ